MQNTPTAHPTIRKKENNFRAEKVDVGWLLKLTSSLGKILYGTVGFNVYCNVKLTMSLKKN